MLSLPRLLIVLSSFLDFIKVVFSFYFKNSSSQKTHIFFQIQSKKIRKKKKKKKKKTSLTTERSAKIRARMLTRQKAMRERRDLAPSAAAFGSSFNLRDEDEDDAIKNKGIKIKDQSSSNHMRETFVLLFLICTISFSYVLLFSAKLGYGRETFRFLASDKDQYELELISLSVLLMVVL